MAAPSQIITVYVEPITGEQIVLKVANNLLVANLKKLIGNKLRFVKDNFILLLKNKNLDAGTLAMNRVVDGSKLTLLPMVETGLATNRRVTLSTVHRPEQNIRQALENLTDKQVDNFLSGKAPLNLTIRLGDHMMFIQLQLSSPNAVVEDPTKTSDQTPPQSPNTPLSFCLPATEYTIPPPTPPPSPCKVESPQQNPASKALVESNHYLASKRSTTKEKCEVPCKTTPQGGAVIESMIHHGKGVYSGTFSGTLSPNLQDKNGRPKRDISTIMHILNDLLGASSQCPYYPIDCQSPISSKTQEKPETQIDHLKEDENKVTRDKVELLQSKLEERKQRRKARKEVRYSPYTCRANKLCADITTLVSSKPALSGKNETHPELSSNSTTREAAAMESAAMETTTMESATRETAIA